jgi:uncharacterized protein VirK/YbjX
MSGRTHRRLLREAVRLSALAYPGWSPRSLWLRGAVVVQCWRHRRSLGRWYAPGADALLQEALAQRPTLAAIVHWPYLHRYWTVDERLHAVERHYAMLRHDLDFLRFAGPPQMELASVDSACGHLRIVLDQAPWFMREGEAVFNLFLDGERMYSLAFTLGEGRGARLAYVGALQGRNLPQVLDIYRAMTRAAHGLRPRDLLFTCFRMLCVELGIGRIQGVSDAACALRAEYFGANAGNVRAEYDTIWTAYGGVPEADGFFGIDARLTRRRDEDIASNKRALYRRRYAMLDALSRQLSARLRLMAVPRPLPLAEAA